MRHAAAFGMLLYATHALHASAWAPPRACSAMASQQHHRCHRRQQQQQQRSWHPSQCPWPRAAVFMQDKYVRGEDSDDDIEEGGKLAESVNPYVLAMQNIPAPELIKGFAETAPTEVQAAVRSTVVSLLGNLPPHLYDVNVMSTGQNVASLMYSMQMTGYMFRNAEYRRSLLETLEGDDRDPSTVLNSGDATEGPSADLPPVKGKIKVKLSKDLETEVDASAYMAELRNEVQLLRGKLAVAKQDAQDASVDENGLLVYMQTLGRENVETLTSSVSQDVLDAMRMLIENVLSDAGVGSGESFMETSGLKLRELLVWQLITGYKLRELEAQQDLDRLLDDDEEQPPEKEDQRP